MQHVSSGQITWFGLGLGLGLGFGFGFGFGLGLVLLDEQRADDLARVRPLVQELIEHAGVAVLAGEAGAEHLEAHARRGLDDRWVVAEPPPAVDVQVAKLAREHAPVGGSGRFRLGL